MKILHLSIIIAILGTSFIFADDVFADGVTSPDSFLKKCNDGTSTIPTLIPQSGNSSAPKQGMLLMKPDSVAMICVKYLRPSGWHSSIDINNTKLDRPLPVAVENIHVSGSSVSFGSLFVNNVMVSKAQPNTISFGPDDNTSTVILYTVSARSDSKGYYHLELPYLCEDVPLAVGYDVSQLDPSAFQDLDKMCFNFGVETSLMGISGANMTYVDRSNEPVHSTKLAENISIIPPLQQVKFFDTSAKSVRCNLGLQLIFKAEDDSPACAAPNTSKILIERGWAKTIVANAAFGTVPSDTTQKKIHVTINGVDSGHSFNYTITGGQIEQARADIINKELVLSIKSTGNGTLIVDLPRALIDAKMNGQDVQFIVLEDRKEILYKQTTSTIQSRILDIPFQYGVSQIEIIAPVPIR